jgi:membrane protein DedA with SNARE-associated domain
VNWLIAPYDFLNWVADQLFLLMNDLYGRFGVPIVFVAALTEATFGLGVVFPGVVLMFLAGAYTRSDPALLAAVLAVAVLGTMIGDTVSYGLGRWGSRFVESSRFAPSLRLGMALVTGRTRWVIPFYHLHSVSRAVGPFGAGAVRMPLRIWVPLDYLGALIANTVWVGSGAVLGTAVLTDEGTLEQHPALRIGLALAAMAWFLVMQRLVTKRLEELNAHTAEDATPDAPTVEAVTDR